MIHVVLCFLLLVHAQVGEGAFVTAEGITIPADAKGMPDGDYGIRADVERPMSLRLTGKDVIAVLTITRTAEIYAIGFTRSRYREPEAAQNHAERERGNLADSHRLQSR